jgi:hypothetical protein
MELGIQKLGIARATSMPSESYDHYKMLQIHDYAGVKLPIFDAEARKAMQEIITVFAVNYPEMLSRQFLVNVTVFDSLIVKMVQGILATNTKKRLKTVRKASHLPDALPELGRAALPPEYGGLGISVFAGETVRLHELLDYGDGVLDAAKWPAIVGTADEHAANEGAGCAVPGPCCSGAKVDEHVVPHMVTSGRPAKPCLSVAPLYDTELEDAKRDSGYSTGQTYQVVMKGLLNA